jgi:hypothetical protein
MQYLDSLVYTSAKRRLRCVPRGRVAVPHRSTPSALRPVITLPTSWHIGDLHLRKIGHRRMGNDFVPTVRLVPCSRRAEPALRGSGQASAAPESSCRPGSEEQATCASVVGFVELLRVKGCRSAARSAPERRSRRLMRPARPRISELPKHICRELREVGHPKNHNVPRSHDSFMP